MKKIILLCFGMFGLLTSVYAGKVPMASLDLGAAHKGGLVSPQLTGNILDYQEWGGYFVFLQTHWFKLLFGYVTLGILIVFLLHYLIIGPKRFSHKGERFYVFSLFMRVIHWMAAISFILIIPTGFMMVFGKYFGGGNLVLFARYLHDIGTVLFTITVIPMFLVWLVPMLPTVDDIKWIFMAGGYLSKKKREIPAGKFNAGQKMWFWLATIGGFVMIITGAMMYFQDFDLPILKTIGLDMDQIDLDRLAAIVHNFLGVAVAAFFITHLYMSIFAIKGSLESMLCGYKDEDELKHLHSSYYKKLIKKEQKRAEPS
jgi:formate dehydrogenase subunit gamma